MTVTTKTSHLASALARRRGDRAGADRPARAWPDHGILSFFVFLWAGNFVLAELALREMTPIAFSAARLVAGAASMLLLLHLQTRLATRRDGRAHTLFHSIRREDWPRLLLVSVLGATLAPWLGIEGLKLTDSGRASLWLALGPVLSYGVGYLWRTERIGWVGLLGTVLAGLGTLALAVDGLRTGGTLETGDLLLFLSLLLTVVELHLARPLVARYGATFTAASRTALGGFLYLLIASPAMARVAWGGLSGWTWIAILLGGSVGVGVGQWAKLHAITALGPTRVILYGDLVPLATVALAWLALGNRPSSLEVAAGGLIVLGSMCLQVLDPASRPAAITGAADAGTAPGVAEAAMDDL
ncbi:MAG TPA: DMT family transporter [Longimicrobiaceae bacterium]|nr:DMT family transporter [Longimicrobiaceae bacterium]